MVAKVILTLPSTQGLFDYALDMDIVVFRVM